jgi:LCP family protein required for cell wall assembly
VSVPRDILQVLLIGADGAKYVKDQNTDVMIVAVINRSTKQVSMLSIPRDLWVYIPTYGWGRINTAHRIGHRKDYPDGGPALLMRTIEHNLGIPLDNWVRVDLRGFARAVDELGGVEMTVACPVNLRYRPPTSDQEQEMWLLPGVYQMDGATALRYVRTRRGGDDFQRAPRQHQFLRAMWDQFREPGLIAKIPGLWSALKDSVHTDLGLADIMSLAPLALELKPERIRSRYIAHGQVLGWTTDAGARVQLPLHDKIQDQVSSLYAPPSAKKDSVAEEAARIQVLNGTQRSQLDRLAADQLHWQGLNVVDAGPAQERDHQHTQVIAFDDRPEALGEIVRLLKIKPENILLQAPSLQVNPGEGVDILVILGEDYDPCH